MWIAENQSTGGLELPDDIRRAILRLQKLLHNNRSHLFPSFDNSKALVAARAPGRLDVMGGIADYSGSTVLQLPLMESSVALCQRIEEPHLILISNSHTESKQALYFDAPVSDFVDKGTGKALPLEHIREYFANLPENQQWAAYVAGVLPVLMNEFHFVLAHGIVLCIDSVVPVGKGVSSSAAIEVSAMSALAKCLALDIDAHQLALLCQRVENQVVGAPCGLMDQMTSSAGVQGHLLTMLCQPDIVRSPTTLPDELALWGIDSGLRHAVSGADYGSVRVAAFMGYRLLLEFAGIADADVLAAKIKDSRWRGYLANISVSEFTQDLAMALPEEMFGSKFLDRFDATTDSVTAVDPQRSYAVRACTAHPIFEHFRTRLFCQLSQSLDNTVWNQETACLMGECMYQSHASYSACGLGSLGTDDIVARFRRLGPASGIYGARITGGGSGGTVAVLTRADAGDVVESVAFEYAKASGIGGQVFSGSSAGASVYEVTALAPD